MGVYDRQTANALRMIAKYGESCTWFANVDSVPPDPSKPWETGDDEPVEHIGIKIAFFPLEIEQYKSYQVMTGTEVPTGVYIAYMGRVPFEVGIKDSIRRSDGKMLAIVNMNVVNPNGEGAILYEIWVRE